MRVRLQLDSIKKAWWHRTSRTKSRKLIACEDEVPGNTYTKLYLFMRHNYMEMPLCLPLGKCGNTLIISAAKEAGSVPALSSLDTARRIVASE
jgi:hypothetical protein